MLELAGKQSAIGLWAAPSRALDGLARRRAAQESAGNRAEGRRSIRPSAKQ